MNVSLIGEQIAKFRRAAGLTQEDLGKAVGVSTQAVSRWECGGAPDVSLLPAIADRLGVTIDALFGREGGVVEDIHGTVKQWLLSLPEERRLDQLCRLVWGTAMDSYVRRLGSLNSLDIGYMDSCVARSGEHDMLVRMAVETDEGLSFGVGAEDMAFMSLWPRPEEGYTAWFAPRDLCRRLFDLLARPGCLELLERLHDDIEPRYYVPEVLAKQLGLPPEDTTRLLAALEEQRLVKKLDLELETGTVSAYIVHENWAFVPFMLFTRCLMEKRDAFYILWHDFDVQKYRGPGFPMGRLTMKRCDPGAASTKGDKTT